MQRIPPETTDSARRLRREATVEERLLWPVLCQSRPRFTWQLAIDRHIVDFARRSTRIVIELDGGQHASRTEEDAIRTAHLEKHGWMVARFWNNDVRDHLKGAVDTILRAVSRASTHPQPLPSREGS